MESKADFLAYVSKAIEDTRNQALREALELILESPEKQLAAEAVCHLMTGEAKAENLKPRSELGAAWNAYKYCVEKQGGGVLSGLRIDFDEELVLARDAALEEAAQLLLGGRFLHDDAPTKRLAEEAAKAIRKKKMCTN